jgi:cytochrome b involved in lipid metabolism
MSNDNSGAIFRNKRKEKDSHPDRTGQCTINGKEYWISGWMKEKDGEPYMSLAFKPKDAKPAEKPRSSRDADDSIPF